MASPPQLVPHLARLETLDRNQSTGRYPLPVLPSGSVTVKGKTMNLLLVLIILLFLFGGGGFYIGGGFGLIIAIVIVLVLVGGIHFSS